MSFSPLVLLFLMCWFGGALLCSGFFGLYCLSFIVQFRLVLIKGLCWFGLPCCWLFLVVYRRIFGSLCRSYVVPGQLYGLLFNLLSADWVCSSEGLWFPIRSIWSFFGRLTAWVAILADLFVLLFISMYSILYPLLLLFNGVWSSPAAIWFIRWVWVSPVCLYPIVLRCRIAQTFVLRCTDSLRVGLRIWFYSCAACD